MCGSFRNGNFQRVSWREIDWNAEKIRELVLQTHHVQQGQAPTRVEVGD